VVPKSAPPVPKEIRDLLRQHFPPDVQRLAVELRSIVVAELQPCQESIYFTYALAMSYGPNGRMRDQICHIAIYRQHVNLGFNYGAFMADPHGVLLGEGSQIRHIKIQSQAELAHPAIREYLKRAIEMAEIDDAQDRVAKGVVTVIKVVKPKLRGAKAS
jgi:hypothetical protein